MPRAAISPADAALLEELATRGCPPVSRFQLERWRQHGLLPRPIVEYPRSGGSRVRLPPDSVDIAEILAHRIYRGGNWQVGVVVLFDYGFMAAEAAIRSTAQRALVPIRRLISELRSRHPDADPLLLAEEAIRVERRQPASVVNRQAVRAQLRSRYPYLSNRELAEEALSVITWRAAALTGGLSDGPDDAEMRARAAGWLTLEDARAEGWELNSVPPDLEQRELLAATLTSREMWLVRNIYEALIDSGQEWLEEVSLFHSAVLEVGQMRFYEYQDFSRPLAAEVLDEWWRFVDETADSRLGRGDD